MSKVNLTKLKAMRQEGFRLQQIADYFGVSKQYIAQLCSDLGLSKTWKTQKEEKREQHFEKWGFYPEDRDKFASQKHLKLRLLISQARQRVKDTDIDFTLRVGDFPELPDLCPALGTPLDYVTGSREDRWNSPSLDRLDPKKGYTKDNVRVISWRANFLKSDGNLEELKKITEYLTNNLN